MWPFKKQRNGLLDRLLILKPIKLNEVAKWTSKKNQSERVNYYQAQVDLINEVLDGKG
jgi:hypothetical protein